MNRLKLKKALATVALMALYNLTPAQCFSSDPTPASQRTATRRFFRSLNDDNPMLKSNDVSSLLGNAFSPSAAGSEDTFSKMPTWLSISKSHLVEENINSLKELMAESFFTQTETRRLIDAMHIAAKGDDNKLAGAAEFCMILIETMEMGLNVLIAAAFHYCSCVAAREHSVRFSDGVSSQFRAWDFRPDPGVEAFGKHVLQIERDSARLKRLEIVAAMVIMNSGNSQRMSPSSNDAENLSSLFLTESKDWRALAIRSGACLYRLRGILNSGTAHHLKAEYVRASREALHIYAPLASRLGMHRLKNELEGAAFRILYRRQYERVMSLSHQGAFVSRRVPGTQHNESPQIDIGESMYQILDEVKAEMTEMLSTDEDFSSNVENFSVTARVKEAYSTWKKMLRNGSSHILEVPDAIALRIILDAKKLSPDEDPSVTEARERALCYYAQGLCIERWAPLRDNPRFKDYISYPKANGYQSLHYTASTERFGQDWSIEIQVRSGEMHKVAEFGLASHWDYKARSKSKGDEFDSQGPFAINEHFGKNNIKSSDAYIRSLQEWHWRQHGGSDDPFEVPDEPVVLNDESESRIRADRIRALTQRLSPYIEALTEAQSDLARENVFVFLTQPETRESSEGKVLALPAGAVVLDALRECTRDLDFPYPRYMEEFISHNGSPAVLTSRLQNGDLLSIPSVTPSVTAA